MTTPPPLVFAQTFEGLFHRAYKGQVTPALRERMRAHGVDLDRPLQPAYPVEAWNAALLETARALHPDLPLEAAYQKVGERFLEGFGETLIGSAMMALLRTVGYRRALARMERNFRTGNNYIRSHMVERGPTEVDVHFEDMREPPGFFTGIFLAGARMTGAQGVRVECERTGELQCRFHITWAKG
jgi:uncharacterized protein (TIGR02265 family)